MKRGRLVQSVSRYPSLELVFTEPVLPGRAGLRVPHARQTHRRCRWAARSVRQGGRASPRRHPPGAACCRRCSRGWRRRCERASTPTRRTAGRSRRSTGRPTPEPCARWTCARSARGGRRPRRVSSSRWWCSGTGPVTSVRSGRPRNRCSTPFPRCSASPPISTTARRRRSSGARRSTWPERAPRATGSAGSVHLATFGSFVQAHRGQAERVHNALLEQIRAATAAQQQQADAPLQHQPRPPRVLDLYGGSGAIALSLAAAGAVVHLVESFAPAVAHAEAAAKEQNLSLTAECGDVATALRSILERGRPLRRRGGEPAAPGDERYRARVGRSARGARHRLRVVRSRHAGARPRSLHPPRVHDLAPPSARHDPAHRRGGDGGQSCGASRWRRRGWSTRTPRCSSSTRGRTSRPRGSMVAAVGTAAR